MTQAQIHAMYILNTCVNIFSIHMYVLFYILFYKIPDLFSITNVYKPPVWSSIDSCDVPGNISIWIHLKTPNK